MRIIHKNVILDAFDHALISYPTPSNINYFWNFGILAGLCLGAQLVTGIALAMHYTPHVDLAFLSVEHIMRDVNYGWLFRYLHANGASMFFIAIYFHVFRGLYFGSYMTPRQLPWIVGVIILLLMILTAFLGYVLPWGQMSFWAATVITNLASAIPFIGEDIVQWLWGGFSVDNPTLNRFFSLHYLFPFILVALALIHIILLHVHGANNPLGIRSQKDLVPFMPYFHVKDLFGIIAFLILFSYFLFFNPNVLGHPDNYIPANPMVTPAHIVPEWYFLPFYAILRSIPDKLGGVIAMVAAILILIALPFLPNGDVRSSTFRPLYKKAYWIFVVICLILGWIGGKSPEEPYVFIGQLNTVLYFAFFVVVIPMIAKIENLIVFLYNKK